MIFSNIKIILIFLALSFIGGFGLWVNHLHNKAIRLEKENQGLLQTKQAQENVITITDENHEKNRKLESDINSKVNEIKTKLLAKNQEDFLKKSECIFSNFGKYDYECK